MQSSKKERERERKEGELSILSDNSVKNMWLLRECESYLAIREEKTDAFHADLQKSALTRSHILHRKLTAEFVRHIHTSSASCCLLHCILNAVVHVLTLEETIVDVYLSLKVCTALIDLDWLPINFGIHGFGIHEIWNFLQIV